MSSCSVSGELMLVEEEVSIFVKEKPYVETIPSEGGEWLKK